MESKGNDFYGLLDVLLKKAKKRDQKLQTNGVFLSGGDWTPKRNKSRTTSLYYGIGKICQIVGSSHTTRFGTGGIRPGSGIKISRKLILDKYGHFLHIVDE